MYTLKSGSLIVNPQRPFPTVPIVKLGDLFKTVSGYMSRFASIPDILELDHLTVSGDVSFGSGVSLRVSVFLLFGFFTRI